MSGKTPDVIYEDNHLLIVNKQAGMLVQGDHTGDMPLVEQCKSYIKKKYNKPGNVFLGVVHRLDRPVSGIILFARTGKALARMNRQFRDKATEKKYLAIVKDLPPKNSDKLETYLLKNHKKNKSFTVPATKKGAKWASLTYRLTASIANYHLLEIDLHTGRHHQIRCQLAGVGSPIKGDLKYGFPRSNPDKGISLHAYSLRFIHPVKGEKMTLSAPVPNTDIWQNFHLPD